jgi:hypothetical protein
MSGGSWFHAGIKAMQRSAGKSAVAAAAYRTGARLEDSYYGTVRDFSRKSDVVEAFTVAPDGAPAWAGDTGALWNAVEVKENRKNSVLAYEWEVALPNEVTPGERAAIAREFAGWLVDEYGVAVTVGIHEGGNRGNGLNDHMHVMMTTREIGPEGWGAKVREFSSKPGMKNPEVDRVRGYIAGLINEALEDAGSDERVDHRSFKERGIDREPTTHLGPAATAMERQGMGSGRGDTNRDIEEKNREVIEARLAWQQAELEAKAPEITSDLERELSARWEGWQPLHRASDVQDGVEAGAQPLPGRGEPLAEPLAHGTPADTSEERSGWRRFADRVKSYAAKAAELWHDEGSGAPEGERSVAHRLIDAGRKLWTARAHRDGKAFAEAAWEAAEIAREEAMRLLEAAQPPEPVHMPPDGQHRDRARPGGNVEPPEPDDRPQQTTQQQDGALGPTVRDAFDEAAEDYLAAFGQHEEPETAGKAEPDGQGQQGPDRDEMDIEP